MPPICNYSGKKIETGDMFILEGGYPKRSDISKNAAVRRPTPPEAYGDIYHRECYFELLAYRRRTRTNAK